MHQVAPFQRVINLLDPAGNQIWNCSTQEALARVGSGDPEQVRQIDGHFALLHVDGITIRMARTLGRPMRYFIAKLKDGPCLFVAERIDELHDALRSQGLENQFHPSYSRMVPAHHLVELSLVGCPDPNPINKRYFTPRRNALPADVETIGQHYLRAVERELGHFLDRIPASEPLGVLFSGGVDSGAVFLLLYSLLLRRGESPARLKAFTLSTDQASSDGRQAEEFLRRLGLSMFWEPIQVDAREIDYKQAIRVLEDYKPLDVQSAAMALALCRGIRRRYPQWRYLVDGDGGDENLKDYPIEENPELTIRSVLNNLLLYQEGWGVEAIKHSLTYSGGQSRGHVRSFAPARTCGFQGFSPFALPNVIEVAEGIPFIELTDWNHDRLYALKGEIIGAGIKQVTGLDMPIFPKCRFQHGAAGKQVFQDRFPADERDYRAAFAEIYG